MIKEKRNSVKSLIILIVILFSISNVLGQQYVMNDFTFYPIPDMPRPEKGVTYEDPVFHTNITRITDSPTDVPGSSTDYAQPGYIKHNIENADGTMLIIQSSHYPGWHIWNADPPYNKIKDIPSTILDSHDADCRWDNSDPNLLYCHRGPVLYQWNVQTETITELHDFKDDFPMASYIGMGEEGDASDDRRYWAFFVREEGSYNHTHLIVYDKQVDAIISQLDRGDGTFGPIGQTTYYFDEGVWLRYRSSGVVANLDSVSMTPSGDYVVAGLPPAWIYPRDFSFTRVIETHGHLDIAIDSDGKEVLVDSKADVQLINGEYEDWARLSDVATGEQWLLAPIGRIGGAHFSGNAHNKPGWAVYSTNAPDYPEDPDEWYEHIVMIVELTRKPNLRYPSYFDLDNHTLVWVLAHPHSIRKGYADDVFAKFNLQGTKVFFGSGWHTSVYDGKSSGAQYDVYQIDLPMDFFKYFGQPIQPECNDTIDNDGDGDIDYPDDGGCGSLTDDDETNCGDDVCEGSEDCSDCPEDCLDNGEQCCNGVAYDPTDKVCCSGAVYTGICCDDSDCTLPETCNVNHICSEPAQIPEICNGLKILMHFDEDSLTVTDHSENGNQGTVNGATYTSSGRFSGAFEYDGIDDHISFDSISGLSPNIGTLSVWFNRHSDYRSGDASALFSSRESYQSDNIGISLYDWGYVYNVKYGLGGTYSTDTDYNIPADSNWHNLVISWENGNWWLYHDGAEVESGIYITDGWDRVYPGYIGATRTSSPISFFNGTIDEVAVWNRALSSQEISGLFDNAGPISCQTTSSCSSGADKDNSGEVSMVEVVAFIGDWKTGSITIGQVIQAIGEWKDGC